MTTQTPGFDPRYDPAFQRGFAVAPPSIAPSPLVERPPSVEPVETTPVETTPVETTPAEIATPADLFELDFPAPLAPLRGNPWVIALWVVSAAMIVGGIGLQWQAQQFFMDGVGSDATGYALQSLFSSIGPWFTLVGLAGVVGVMFLHATRWRARP
jgi:hypothetical protein